MDLESIVVSSETAAGIVAHAYRNIPVNFPASNTFYTGFYRESTFRTKPSEEEKHQYVIESVVQVNKPPYNANTGSGNIKIVESRKFDFPAQDSTRLWFGGVHTPLRRDIAKEVPEFVDPRHQHKYNYRVEGYSSFNDEPVYIIRFLPAKKSARFQGLIYISTRSYAIVKADYEATETELHAWNIRYRGTLKRSMFRVNYMPVGDRWHLQSIWRQAEGLFSQDRFRYLSEYVTTQADTNKLVKFDYAEKVQYAEILSIKKLPYHPEFWRDYNIIEETEGLKNLLIDTALHIDPGPLRNEKKKKQPRFSKTELFKRLRPIYILPGITYITSDVNRDVAFRFASDENNVIVDQTIPVKGNVLAWGIGWGLSYQFPKNTNISVYDTDGFGSFRASSTNLEAERQFLLTSPAKRPVSLLLGISYSFSSISRQLNRYTNPGIEIHIDSKRFDNDIKVELYSEQQALRPFLGLNVELSRSLNLFAQCGYSLFDTHKDYLRFTDQPANLFRRLFPTNAKVPLNSDITGISSENIIKNGNFYKQPYSINIGLKGWFRVF